LAALFLILLVVSFALLPVAVFWGVFLEEPRALRSTFYLLPTVFVTGILAPALSAGVRCPLCRGEVLKPLHSGSNGKARPLLGSRRLRVIVGIFFVGNYRCMHCGEPCETQNPRH
jgi:DNA-directed RNA polymerase subunit RPC12/RpoP